MINKGNAIKTTLLEMSIGTASGRLRKMIIFDLAKKLNLDVCYRCDKKIDSIESLSIEHKIPWQSSMNPKELFFDLDNIAFSHLSCNIKASDPTNRFTAKMKKTPDGYYFCNKCRKTLPGEQFWNNRSRMCRKQNRCKNCIIKGRQTRRK